MRKLVCACVGVAVLGGVLVAQDSGTSPGRRAQAEAFVSLLGDESLAPIAERSLQEMGADALPALAAGLLSVSNEVNVRAGCARLLAHLGRESDAAKAALMKAAGDRVAGVRVAACLALLRLNDTSEPVIAGLASALAAPEEQVRRAAATGLQSAGKDAKSAIPALIRVLGDRDDEVRRQARAALAGMGVAAVDALNAGTKSDDPVQRASAVLTLGELGRDAEKAVPRLTEMLDDDLDRVKIDAAVALGAIGPGAKDAAPKLRGLLHAPRAKAELRAAALQALDRIQPDGWEPVQELLRMWKSEDALVRAFAATELGRRRVKETVPALMVGLNDMSHLVRREAALALARIDPTAPEVLLVLKAALMDRFVVAPAVAAQALGEMGSHAASTKPLLQEAAQSADDELAAAAAEALRRIG